MNEYICIYVYVLPVGFFLDVNDGLVVDEPPFRISRASAIFSAVVNGVGQSAPFGIVQSLDYERLRD